MKRFSVIVTPEAQAGIRESFLYIHERSPHNGERWLRQLYAQIENLEQFPDRCEYAREREYLKRKFGSSSSNLIASSFRWTRLPILFTCFTFDMPADVRSVNQRKRKIQSEAAEPETLSPPTVFSNMSP